MMKHLDFWLRDKAERRALKPLKHKWTLFFFNVLAWFLVALCALPFKWWFYSHREIFWGILIGSILEAGVIFASRWSLDRYLWIRWFSWN